ncbi:PTS system, sucrose-specific IIC component [Sarcina sp. DSM 11001]|uniref:PTS beta-glucoside transporter subunit IIBCA n=1 Tax=Sarcina sp. DSM 11001 TaxID=1798184 RepID=UPI00088419E8|nr:PTS transporter subunit IIBCA [Sarcina sp. DSM 11001]SDK83608.1 PTS system, sucrose-specific IIC component [Sarcina sp. DSM 11001]
MALDYRKCAQEISDNIGGGANVVSAAHCATRLRLVIADNGKVNKAALEEVDGVKGMFESNGQLQLIIGTGTVNKVFDEFIAITGVAAGTKDDVKAAAAAKAPVWRQALKTVGDVFVPILPAIVASGLMMGLVEALAKIPGLGFGNSDWFAFLDTVANTAFAYLPVIVAVSAARVFGGNLFLGAVIGLLMIHSAFLNGWNVANTDAINSFFGVTDGVIPRWHLIGNIVTIQRSGYQGHVIPVIIAVWLMSIIEKWLHKHVPEMIDLFVTPLCTVLATAFLTLWIVGPIFSTLETYVLAGAKILVRNPIGSGIMGAIYPWTVVMGLHHMYNVIEAGMLAETGLNTWMPIASAANFAQFGACLAVGLKVKNQKTKSVAIPSSMSAALGITEPAIFGVNMRFFKPFICGMIGGAVGALLAAFMGFGATAYGVTGIPGYLTVSNPVMYTIVLAIAGGIAFAGTWMFWKEEEKKKAPAAPVEQIKVPEQTVISCSAGVVKAPSNGEVIARDDIEDETFASGVLGDGVGIRPSAGYVVAPFDGEITSVADSKHAIGLSTPSGMELLIHVGVDTVAMNGDGFDPQVAEGDQVKAGQLILNFDIDKIKAAGHPDTVVVLLTNADDYDDVKCGVQ